MMTAYAMFCLADLFVTIATMELNRELNKKDEINEKQAGLRTNEPVAKAGEQQQTTATGSTHYTGRRLNLDD